MYSSQEISSSDSQLSTPSSSKIPQDLKEQFYQSFLKMNEEVMTQLIEAHGLEVVYSDFDYSDNSVEDIKINHTDPISRMAFICNYENRFDFESCKIFIKLLNQEQRIKIIESINLRAFLDSYLEKSSLKDTASYEKYSYQETAIGLLFLEMVKVEHSKNSAENHDFKKCFRKKILSQYLDKENLNSKNPLFGDDDYYHRHSHSDRLSLFGQLQYLITCEDVAKILTAFNPSNPDNDFFLIELLKIAKMNMIIILI